MFGSGFHIDDQGPTKDDELGSYPEGDIEEDPLLYMRSHSVNNDNNKINLSNTVRSHDSISFIDNEQVILSRQQSNISALTNNRKSAPMPPFYSGKKVPQ